MSEEKKEEVTMAEESKDKKVTEKKDISAQEKKKEPKEQKISSEGEEKKEKKSESEIAEEDKSSEIFSLGDLNFYSEIRKDIPELKSGDIIKVFYRVIEGGKERIQVFEGTVIAKKNSGIAKTITVRKTSFGIAVERIFPINSKLVQKIEIKKHSKVRRAKLYYLRKLKGKAAKLKELR